MTSDDQERIVGPRRIYSGVGVKVKVVAKGYLSKAPWVEKVEDSSNERAIIVVVKQDVRCTTILCYHSTRIASCQTAARSGSNLSMAEAKRWQICVARFCC